MKENKFLLICVLTVFIITICGCENNSKDSFSQILSANSSYFTVSSEATEEKENVESQKNSENKKESSYKKSSENKLSKNDKSKMEEHTNSSDRSSSKNKTSSVKKSDIGNKISSSEESSKKSKPSSADKSVKDDKISSSNKSDKESMPSSADRSSKKSLSGSADRSSKKSVSGSADKSKDQDKEAAESKPEIGNEEDNSQIEIAIPIIYIETENRVVIPDTKEKVRCSISLEYQKENYFATELPADIRYRGNGSLNVAKEFGKFPYKIKFDKKENPFDIGAEPNRDWILIPNRSDRTMLRNFAAKKLGEKLSGITYSPGFMAVHVFVNGKYEGVYEVSEQVEAAKGRVPVDDSLSGDENGFLVELDQYAKNPDADDITFTVGKNYYTVKSKINKETQTDFIKEYINKTEKAIYSGDEKTFCELVDIDSAVDMYLLQEFSKNIDGGFSSFYMYKNVGEKLYFSPPWDFDLAFGNDKRLDSGSPDGLYIATGRKNLFQNHLWYIELCKNEWFTDRVKARWKKISNSEIVNLITEVEKKADFLNQDMIANFRRWPEFSERLHQEPEHTLKFTTYKEHTDHLVLWMKKRKEFLDGIYG